MSCVHALKTGTVIPGVEGNKTHSPLTVGGYIFSPLFWPDQFRSSSPPQPVPTRLPPLFEEELYKALYESELRLQYILCLWINSYTTNWGWQHFACESCQTQRALSADILVVGRCRRSWSRRFIHLQHLSLLWGTKRRRNECLDKICTP